MGCKKDLSSKETASMSLEEDLFAARALYPQLKALGKELFFSQKTHGYSHPIALKLPFLAA